MVTQLHAKFETTLMTSRNLNSVRRDINQKTGEWIVTKKLPVNFSRSAYYEYPNVVRKRSKAYAKWKKNKVGHDIPWRLTGASAQQIPADAKARGITKTANGGKVKLRARWGGKALTKKGGGFAKQGMRESQRQELEAISPRQRDRMAKLQERLFADALKDPKNLRKRRRKG